MDELEPVPNDAFDTPEAAIAYSQAISLKRIADALEKLVPDDPRDNPIYKALNEPLNHYGENIGECIQGQFRRKDFE